MQITATVLDLGILIIVALSLIIGLIRGFVREAISLATWLAAFAFAILYLKPLSNQLPFALQSEIARMGMAFAIIFFGVLVMGAIINFLLSAAISSIGLGGVDRFFGALFGTLRGCLIVTLLVILMSLTSFPAQAWWIESHLIPYFEQGADWLKSRIPQDFADYLGKTEQSSPN